MSVRLLHIADVHLGASCAFLGEHAGEHRARLEAALGRALAAARDRQCDLVLIAGDLFDSERPSERLLQQAMRMLANCGLPVCLIAGTHDMAGRRSPYGLAEWKSQCPNVHLMVEASPGSVPFADLGLMVHGRAAPRGESPLQGLSRDEGHRWNVALAHGGLGGEGVLGDAHPISSQEIAASRFDYMALGHWHGWREWREGGTVACYPGAPEPLAFDQADTGWAALVTLDESVTVERVRVGATRAAIAQLRVEGLSSPSELVDRICTLGDAELLLQVRLSGLVPEGWVVDTEGIARACGDRFAALEVVDCTEQWAAAPEAVGGAGIAAMLREEARRRMEAVRDDTERRVIGEALRLGLAALDGREVI